MAQQPPDRERGLVVGKGTPTARREQMEALSGNRWAERG